MERSFLMSLMHVELWVGSVWNYKYVYIFIIKTFS